MSHQNKNRFVGFTTSCLKKPFSFRGQKKKPSTRSIHTMNAWSSEVPSHLHSGTHEPRDNSPGRETNVNKIIKMIPGLRRSRMESVEEPDIECLKTTVMPLQSEMSKLIVISPPSKSDKTEKSESRRGSPKKSRNSDRQGSSKKYKESISSHRLQPRRSRKESRTSLKVSERNQYDVRSRRLNISRICLNVSVSGPMYFLLEKIKKNEIKTVVTLSGAGISTAAGIPDFRSPDIGLYDKLTKYNLPYAQAVFERKYFDKNPKPFYALLKESLVKEYKPTVAHYFIKLLEEKGLLLRHFTQNVDGLERLAGTSHDKIVEAHGTVYTSRCMKCKTEYDLQWLRDQLIYQGKSIPYCQKSRCLGIVKPNVVLFGEPLNPQFNTRVSRDLPRCDLLIIMGTSLVVEPFASAVKKVQSFSSRVIINNIPVGEHLGIVYEGSKDFNKKKKKGTWRDIFIQGSCEDGVLHLAKLFEWERELRDLVKRCEPCHTPSNSPLQPVAQSSKYKNSARAAEIHSTLKIDKHHNQKVGVLSESKRSTEKRSHSPARQLLMTDTSTVPKEHELSFEDQTSKNWWQSLTSRVRNFTNHVQR